MTILHAILSLIILLTSFALDIIHGPLADPVVQHYWPDSQNSFAHLIVLLTLMLGFIQQHLYWLWLLPLFGMVVSTQPKSSQRNYPLPRYVTVKGFNEWLWRLSVGKLRKCPYHPDNFTLVDEADNFDVMENVPKARRDRLYNDTDGFERIRLMQLTHEGEVVAVWLLHGYPQPEAHLFWERLL